MADGWERLAREDALFHVDPGWAGGSVAEFRAGGDLLVDWVLEFAGDVPRGRALEIGFGVGRNLVHRAGRFERVDGVDVSPTMLELTREAGVPANVTLHATDGRSLPFEDSAFGLVHSHLVFQHVADGAVLEAHLREVARVLAPDGRAVLQFDTRRLGPAARVVRALPDALLPRSRRRHMRRVPRTAAWVRETAASAGLAVEAEHGADGPLHWFRLYRPGG